MPPVSRKRRSTTNAQPASAPASIEAPPEEAAAATLSRSARTELRNEELRAALAPLQPGEWPAPLVVAIVVAGLLAAAVIAGAATVHDLSSRGGSVPGAAFLALVLVSLALGMYRRRYWAVLGFQGLLAFQILVTSLALIVASTFTAAGVCLLSIVLSGWLFWKLVRVMGRIQAHEHREQVSN